MLPTLFARLRATWRGLSRPSQLDAEMDDEMRFHVEMQAERLAKERHLDPAEARRQAYVEFGGVEKWKEAGRDTRGTQWIDGIVMDCRIGLRMLMKHRSLTIIGAFTMTVTIAIGATSFEIISEALNPALPSRAATGWSQLNTRPNWRAFPRSPTCTTLPIGEPTRVPFSSSAHSAPSSTILQPRIPTRIQ